MQYFGGAPLELPPEEPSMVIFLFFTSATSQAIEVLVGVLYPRYRWSLVTAQNSGYDRFPPVANGWGTTHSVPDMAPPL
jgi:hypothetical protein